MSKDVIRIPREEYPKRWKSVKQVMKENNLDVILAYSDDRFTHGNAYDNATLSVHPTLSFPHCVHKPFLYVCVFTA